MQNHPKAPHLTQRLSPHDSLQGPVNSGPLTSFSLTQTFLFFPEHAKHSSVSEAHVSSAEKALSQDITWHFLSSLSAASLNDTFSVKKSLANFFKL